MQTPIAHASASSPIPVDGRILPADKAGDSSAWIEIAQYNGYSLIMRQTPLTSSVTTYSSSVNSNSYAASIARSEINTWYRSRLSSSSRLRNYAVKSNAMTNLGSMGVYYVDGISTPTGVAAPTGDDTVFLLSFNEAVLYCSTQYVTETPAQVKPTSNIAYNNYYKLLPRDTKTTAPAYWLRTQGMYYYAAGCVAYSGGTDYDRANGRAYQHTVIGTYGHYRPAVWVGSGIFESKGTVNIRHENIDGGAMLRENSVSLDPGPYGPYGPENFIDYDYVGLKPGSDPISGTIGEGQTKNIIHQYRKKPATYTVTYYPNYGVGSINSYSGAANTYFTVTSQGYTRTDYEFIGWNTNPNGGGTTYQNGDIILLTADISLYAMWRYAPTPNYNIIYFPNGGDGFTNLYSAPGGTYHTVFDQGYTRAGYTFDGWDTASNGTGVRYANGDRILVNNHIILYAQWKLIPTPEFRVTYYANNGSGIYRSYNVPANTYYTVVDQGFINSGYMFNNWNTRADGTGTTYVNGAAIYITGNVDLYAQWRMIDTYYYVIYTPNMGVGMTEAIMTDNQGRITISGDRGYTRFNHTFNNWNTMPDGSGTTYTPGQVVTLNSTIVLYAQWIEIPARYNIYYDPGLDGYGGYTVTGLLSGANHTVLTSTEAGVIKPNYNFRYWNTRIDGLGTTVMPGDTILITSQDIILYAIWYSAS